MNDALNARAALITWLAVVLIASAAGVFARLHPPAPQIIVLALTLVVIVAERRVASLNGHIAKVRTRALVAFHLTRFVGFGFLALAARGALPRDFAVPSGWGDVGVAALAVLLLIVGGNPRGARRPLWIAWNALGMLDLVFVIVNAGQHAMTDPSSMTALLRLPMSLLPFFLVPNLLATHVWMLRRLLGRGEGEAA